MDISDHKANHEEADIRVVLNAIQEFHGQHDNIFVSSRDTDVMLLLLAHLEQFSCNV